MMNVQINYLAEETSEGSETDFDRTFTLSENDMEIGKLHWDGKNNYEKDQMEANNSIAIETQGLARDLFVLHLDVVGEQIDRKSTRLNSSHVAISYAVFCLKKK